MKVTEGFKHALVGAGLTSIQPTPSQSERCATADSANYPLDGTERRCSGIDGQSRFSIRTLQTKFGAFFKCLPAVRARRIPCGEHMVETSILDT